MPRFQRKNTQAVVGIIGLVSTLLVLLSSSAIGQTRLIATSDEGRSLDDARVRVLLEHEGPEAITGWTLALCHDSAVASVTGVQFGESSLVINAGQPPEFHEFTLGDDGWSVSAVIDLDGIESLSPSLDYDLYRADYQLVGGPETLTALDFCGSVDGASVSLGFSTASTTIVPSSVSGQLEIKDRPTQFIAPYVTVPVTGPGAQSATLTLQAQDYVSFALWQGVALGLTFDSDVVDAVGAVPAGALAQINDGAGPDFFQATVVPGGIGISVVYSLIGSEQFGFPVLTDLVDLELETVESVDQFGALVPVEWVDLIDIGAPLSTIVVGSGGSFLTIHRDGLVRFDALPQASFLRGDCDSNGSLEIGDPIEALQHLFAGLSIDCRDACDVDADGNLDLVDPIRMLGYLFLGGDAPPAPFPTCGLGAEQIECSGACP